MPDPAAPIPPVQITGLVQGLVLGNQGTVNQTFRQVRHEPFVPREAPATPPHWVERAGLQGVALEALAAHRVVALVGMGGAGKSTLAARIARAGEAHFARGCFWINLAGGQVDDALLRIALAFGHDVSGLDSREARARTARSLLAGQPVLLVLDDVWDARDLAPFLPPPAGCAALLTTRNDAIAAQCAEAVLTIDSLADVDAAALLAAAAGVAADEPALPKITHIMGGLPLALELAGKLARQQARRPGFAWPRFVDELQASAQARLALGLAGSTVQLAFDASWQRGLDDAGRRAFALLGLFERGDIACGEAAAAWGVDEAAARLRVNTLLDLSLAQLADAQTLRLHPLLADDAAVRAEALPEAERIAAHQRVADHHFDGVPGAPAGLADVLRVLRSHRHAVLAGDRDRAARVWPWFGRDDGRPRTPMPAELIARGLLARHVEHQRLACRLLAQAEPWARCWASYRLGDALLSDGQVGEADRCFDEALRLIESPAVDDDGRALGLSKFLIASGHAKAALGQLAEAEQAYRRAYEADRALARRGGVIGAHDGAMLALLQLADLQRASDDPALRQRGIAVVQEVFDEAMQAGRPSSAWMAAQRMADSLSASRPDQAASWLRRAWAIAEASPEVASGGQGARYAGRLADTAGQLCLNGELSLDVALAGITLAIRLARGAGSANETCRSLQVLGSLLEHLHLLDMDAPLDAAWAAYQLSDDALRDVDFGVTHFGAERIAHRIRPRVAPDQRDAVAAAVAADPWGVLAAAVAPHSLAPIDT